MAEWDRSSVAGGSSYTGGGGGTTMSPSQTDANSSTSSSGRQETNSSGSQKATESTSSSATNTSKQTQTQSDLQRDSYNKSSSKSGSSTQTSMTPTQLAALNGLIAELQGGGTAEQRVETGQRNRAIEETRALQNAYSKEAAFNDAEGAMAAQLRLAMQELLPGIVKASEGAGTSQSALRALLLTNAQQQAADAAALQGMSAAVSYGNIATNAAGILEALTRESNTQTEALLQALNIAKGSVVTNSYRESQSESGNSMSSKNSTATNNVTQTSTSTSLKKNNVETTNKSVTDTSNNSSTNSSQTHTPSQATGGGGGGGSTSSGSNSGGGSNSSGGFFVAPSLVSPSPTALSNDAWSKLMNSTVAAYTPTGGNSMTVADISRIYGGDGYSNYINV